jgi:leucyl-tRNA synthetase
MRQWYLRITEYADRLLQGLETVQFSDAMKEMQRNWIGKSEGAEMQFAIDNSQLAIKVYTTRPDTIFGW